MQAYRQMQVLEPVAPVCNQLGDGSTAARALSDRMVVPSQTDAHWRGSRCVVCIKHRQMVGPDYWLVCGVQRTV